MIHGYCDTPRTVLQVMPHQMKRYGTAYSPTVPGPTCASEFVNDTDGPVDIACVAGPPPIDGGTLSFK